MSSKRKVAFEIEIPMVTDDKGTPSTHAHLEALFKKLCDAHAYHLMIDPTTEGIVGVKGATYGYLTPDNGVSTLELSSEPDDTIDGLKKQWAECLQEIHDAAPEDVRFLSLARQPNMNDDPETYTRMVCKKGLYPVFHRRGWSHRKGLTTASVQPNIDVTVEEAISVINVLNALAGPMIGLFANSPIFNGEHSGYMESRITTWPDVVASSRISSDARMIGQLEPVATWIDYLKRVWDNPITYIPDVAGADAHISYKKALCLVPENESLTMLQFLASEEPHQFHLFNGFDFDTVREVRSLPAHADKAFWWGFWSARIRAEFKDSIDHITLARAVQNGDHATVNTMMAQNLEKLYVEVRDIGTTNDPLSGVALVLGLIENLDDAVAFVATRSAEEWATLRTRSVKEGYSAVANEIKEMLVIALRGLEKRGLGEEQYLLPLVDQSRSPAEEVLEQFARGGLAEIIQKNQL